MAVLQFVRGRAYADLDKYLANDIVAHSEKDKQQSIFYLVPEHMKFESEMEMLTHFHQHEKYAERNYMGMLDVQVFSFNRMAWYLLQNSALFRQTQLTQTGLSMLVQSVLLSCEDELTIYKGMVRQTGFITKLADLFKELRAADIDANAFDEFMDALDTTDAHQSNQVLKFHDLQLIYRHYLEALVDKYVEIEDILEALIAYVEAGHLAHASIYINHFYEFNPLEMRLLKAFMQHTRAVTIGLLLDKSDYAVALKDDAHIFKQTAQTYHALYQVARSLQIPIRNDVYLADDLAVSKSLQLVEDYWYRSNQNFAVKNSDLQAIDLHDSHDIVIFAAENKQAEVKHVVNEIRRLVKREDYRFKDIVILARDISEYTDSLEPVCERNNIPIYTSTARTMADHPLVTFIQSLLQIKKNNWRYQDVMALLKTDLVQPLASEDVPETSEERRYFFNHLMVDFRPQVDLTENVVLAYGFQGNDWTRAEDWQLVPKNVDKMLYSDREASKIATVNGVRHFLKRELQPFFNDLEQAKTNREAATILYNFLEYLYVPDMLMAWRDDAIENGQLEKGQEHEQVWQAFVNLLDEFVDVLGDASWSLAQFIDIFKIGFLQAEYNNVPATLDQVILTDLTRLSSSKDKVVFILGMTDQNLPQYSENTSLLTDQERAFINEVNVDEQPLLQDSYKKVATEPFVAYQAFTQATDKLYLTYPKLTGDNKTQKLSPYVARLQEHFNLRTELMLNHPNKEASVSEQLHFVGSAEETFAQAVEIIAEGHTLNLPPNGFWLGLYQNMLSTYGNRSRYRLVNSSLWYHNRTVNLQSETAQALYGKDLYLSVSEIESYYKDPFSHFLTYGLKLKERETVDIDARKAGNFYHETMDRLVNYLIAHQESILVYDSDDKLMALADKILADVFVRPNYFYLERSNRSKMVKQRFSELTYAMAWALREQAKVTIAKPIQTELVFGPYSGPHTITGLTYPLENGGKIQVRGKIDRIDEIKTTDGPRYIGVVDYKSSDNSLSYEKIYNGLQMQLLTYLLVAQKQYADSQAGYALYQHIKQPIIQIKNAKDIDRDNRMASFLKAFKQKGLIMDDTQLLDNLIMRMDDTGSSPVYQISSNKKNDIVKIGGGVHFKAEEAEKVFAYIESLIIQAANNILAGDTRLMPYENELTDSTKTAYRSISQFDVLLPENKYRQLEKMDEASFMASLQKKEDDDD